MTHDKLLENVKSELDHAYDVMNYKNAGYSTEKDALHNFTVAAKLQDCSPAQALGGFLAKHFVSVYDLINSTKVSESFAVWDEKITDSIVYLSILHAMVREAAEENNKNIAPIYVDNKPHHPIYVENK